jgi:hypothetical protein
METEKVDKQLPAFDELIGKTALYKQFDISRTEPQVLKSILSCPSSIDLYCVGCKRMSTFKRSLIPSPGSGSDNTPKSPLFSRIVEKPKPFKHKDTYDTVELQCSRNFTHHIIVIFRIYEDTLTKIGQYPSLADLQLHQLSKYDGVLAESMRKEFARAIGLNAHGIGIGAFVYLRRIFENLIEEAHTKASSEPEWDDELFRKSRMDERIKLLRHHLPDALVANAAIYSILSKGIHELTEDDCLDYYPTLELGIKHILDEKIAAEQSEQTKKLLSTEVARIQSKIK